MTAGKKRDRSRKKNLLTSYSIFVKFKFDRAFNLDSIKKSMAKLNILGTELNTLI